MNKNTRTTINVLSIVFFLLFLFIINVTSAEGVYTGNNFVISDIFTSINDPRAMVSNGTSLFIIKENGNVYEYNSTNSYTGFTFNTLGRMITWNGSSFFVYDGTIIYEYNSTGSLTGFNFSTANETIVGGGLTTNGSHFYVSKGGGVGRIYEYNSTGDYTGFNFPTSPNPRDISYFNNFLYVSDTSSKTIRQYNSTGSFLGTVINFESQIAGSINRLGMDINDTGTFFVVSSNTDIVYMYHIIPDLIIINPELKVYNTNISLLLNYTISNLGFTIDSCWYNIINSTNDIIISNTTLLSCVNTTFSVPRDGTYTLTLYANNTLYKFNNKSVTFKIDHTNPVVVLNTPRDISSLDSGSNVDFNFTVTDNEGAISCSLYSNFTGSWVINESFTFSNVSYTGFNFSQPSGHVSHNVQDVIWNGTHLFTLDGSDDDVHQYFSNGTFIQTFVNVYNGGNNDAGITWNGTSFFIVDALNNRVDEFDKSFSSTGFNFSTVSEETDSSGITWNGSSFFVVGRASDKVYEYNSTGSYTGFNFSVAGETIRPTGIIWLGNSFFIIDTNIFEGVGKVFRYYSNGTYTGFNFSVVNEDTDTKGITWGGSSFFVTGDNLNKVFEYKLQSSVTQTTTKNLSEGNYIFNTQCTDILANTAFALNNFTLIIDTTTPLISIDDISTTAGSQTITFDSIVNDTNLQSCWYSIFNSTGGIDGLNNNISFSCSSGDTAVTSATTTLTPPATYNLTVYTNDSAGNENSTTQSFTTSQISVSTPSTGGGGGEDTTKLNWTIKNNQGGDKYIIVTSQGLQETKVIVLNNLGEVDLIIRLKCQDISGLIGLCQYVTFENDTLVVLPSTTFSTKTTFILFLSSDVEDGVYNINIVGVDIKKDERKLSIEIRVGELGLLKLYLNQVIGSRFIDLSFISENLESVKISNFVILLFSMLVIFGLSFTILKYAMRIENSGLFSFLSSLVLTWLVVIWFI